MNYSKYSFVALQVLSVFYLFFSVLMTVLFMGIGMGAMIYFLPLPVLTFWLLKKPTPSGRLLLAAALFTEVLSRAVIASGIVYKTRKWWYPEAQWPWVLGESSYWILVFLGAFVLVLAAKKQFQHVEKRQWHKGLVIFLGCLVPLLPWLEVNFSLQSLLPGVLAYKPAVDHVLFSPSGKVVSVTNFSVHTYDIESGETEKYTPGIAIFSAVYSNDEKKLILGTLMPKNSEKNGFGIFIYDLRSASQPGHYLTRNMDEEGSTDRQFSGKKVALRPYSQEIAVVTGRHPEGTIEIWDFNTEKQRQRFDLDQISQNLTGKPTYVLSLAFDPSGRYLAAGGMNGDTFLLDLSDNTVRKFSSGYKGEVYDCAFSPDGKTLALAFNQQVDPKQFKGGSLKGYVELWDFNKLELDRRITWESDGRCRAVAVSPDSKYVLSAGDENVVRIWDSNSGEQAGVLTGYPHNIIYSVAISPVGDYVAASGGEFTKFWKFPYAETAKQ